MEFEKIKYFFSNILKFILNPEHILICIFSGFIVLLGYLIIFNVDFLNPISEAISEFSISDLFYEVDNSIENGDNCEIITIIDISDVQNRGDMGILLNEIAICNPKAIGIDVIFEGEKDDKIGNEILLESIESLPPTTVFSAKLIDYNLEKDCFNKMIRSFFADSLKVSEGFTNFMVERPGDIIREIPTAQRLNNDLELSFDVKISDLLGYDLKDISPSYHYPINYKNLNFTRLPSDSIMDYVHLIEGRIVLVGALKEEADVHNTPIGPIPGIEIQAYALFSILSHYKNHKLNTWAMYLLAFFLTWIAELTISATYLFLKKKDEPLFRLFLSQSSIIRDTIIVMFLIFIGFILFVLFTSKNVLIEATIIFAFLAALPITIEIYGTLINVIYSKRKYKIIKRFSNYLDN